MLTTRKRKMCLDFIIFIMTSFLDFPMAPARVKDRKIPMTRMLSVAPTGVFTEQLAEIDHHRFPKVGLYRMTKAFECRNARLFVLYWHSSNIEDFKST